MRTINVRVPIVLAAVLFVVALGFFAALGVRSAVGGPDAAPASAPPNPGHSYDQIELPAGTWTGLDADLLDGLNSDQIQDADDYVSSADYASSAGSLSRLGFSTATVDSFGSYTSVTVGTDGLPVISYFGNGDLKVAHCGNAACTSGNTVSTVDDTGFTGRYSSVTVGADGLPLISYIDIISGDLKVAHCGDAACSSGNTITVVDSIVGFVQYTSVTVGTDGLPIISYYDEHNWALKVAHCGNAACTSGNTVTTVDSGGFVGAYSSVTVGADGLPVISYFDDENKDLKVAHCGNAACTSGNTITTVDSAGRVGYYTSVTVGVDGLPLISYCDGENGDLKVAHCGNAACTSGNTITAVDSTDRVGFHTSVTVGVDALPVISYFDETNWALKVAHCGNAACSADNTISTVIGSGDGGLDSSLTVGSDGLPVISYQGGGELKVAHCSNRFCVPYHRPR